MAGAGAGAYTGAVRPGEKAALHTLHLAAMPDPLWVLLHVYRKSIIMAV
jgi:hypothetical protein